jgi:hypothetical protein
MISAIQFWHLARSAEKRIRYVHALLLILMLFAEPAAAERSRPVLGAGLLTCRNWTDLARARDSAAGALMSWVSGYISGALTHRAAPVTEKPNAIALQAWIDRYCTRAPSQTIQDAAEAYLSERLIAGRPKQVPKTTQQLGTQHHRGN